MDILNFLDLERARSIHSDKKDLSNSEAIILNELEEKEFGVDFIYFNRDEETNNSFPAIFLKKVICFNNVETLKDIIEAQRKIWNYKKVLFLYVYSETEIRIYNCSEKPLIVTEENFDYGKEMQAIEIKSYHYSDRQHLQELNKLFSRIAIDTGIIWTLEDAKIIRDKINLQKRVDKYLVKSLVSSAEHLKNQGLKIDFIHKLILRSLFLLYLEDRGAAEKNFYNQIKKGAESYFDILDDVEATYKLFKRLEDHFNGNVFTLEKDEFITQKQLNVLKTCFIRGYEKNTNTYLFEDWKHFRLFNFKIIQIELLSEIYENFLAETDPNLKEDSGTYYTPPSLVEFILNEKLPINNDEKEYNVKILDPSCGSGIFLVESFKRIVKRYEKAHNINNLSDFNTLVRLLKDNIYGIEINPQAIKVAAFSLYLALVDKLDPKNLWQDTKYRLPYLINYQYETDEAKKGNNLFCRNTISDLSSIKQLKGFNLVVGNPPFGKLHSSEKGKQSEIREYCNRFGFPKEMVLPFLHKATIFAPDGEIALIFNTKILTNTNGTFQNFRSWLFGKCYVKKVYNFSILRNADEKFGGQLFGDATGPISIVFYQKNAPLKSEDYIVYYAPKTYVRSNIIEGLSIDFTDIKYLKREDCKQPDTKLWKVAMWGGKNDWELLKKLWKNNDSFEMYLNKNNFEYGSGLHPKENEKNKVLIKGLHIDTTKIKKYYTSKEDSKLIEKEFRNNNLKLFQHPLAIIKEGITNKGILSSFFDFDIFFNKAVYGFATREPNQAKSISLMFNSDFAKYYFFLTSSSWGIERDRIVLNEYLNFPYIEIESDDIHFQETNFKNNLTITNQNKEEFNKTFRENKIAKRYGLTISESILIKDSLEFSLDLFYKQEKSLALRPVLDEQPRNYAEIVSSEINEFLEGQDLYINPTIYHLKNKSTPLMMIKLSHDIEKKKLQVSNENIEDQLKIIDKYLWEKKTQNIYFRKKLNYKKGDDIYIIRPNQRRFWSKSIALEDASELILEILNGVHDEA